jgi:uncharacterized protein (DUF983 family)
MTPSQPVSAVSAAIAGRCPRCGRGPLFRQVLNLRESCTACGLDYKFIDTGDGPAVFVIFILGFLMMGAALFVEFRYEPPVWVHMVAWGVMTPLIALGLLRLMKGWLIGQQFKHKAEEARLDRD